MAAQEWRASVTTAYDPSDPLQQSFLSALALGESGTSGTASTGYGGVDLSGASTDQYGFPQWQGATTKDGPTHSAGTYQFQPSTWDDIASQFGLNFANPSDQNAGAWDLANQKDPNLESDLQSGNFQAIQNALKGTWTSVTGSASAPKGLANDLATGTGAAIPAGANSALDPSTGGTAASSSGQGGIFADIENWFERGGLILLGGLIILVALWVLLSHTGAIPSPGEFAGDVAKAA